jgi:hypothetical protein
VRYEVGAAKSTVEADYGIVRPERRSARK